MWQRADLPSAVRRGARAVCGATLAGLLGVLSLSACGAGGAGRADDAEAGGRPDRDGVITVPVGERAKAPALAGPTVAGRALDQAAYRGRVVVVNVWSSTCAPCRAEAPAFAKVAARTKGKGVAFLGINTRDVRREAARAFEADHEVGYPSLYDPDGKMLLRFPRGTFVQAVPTTVVLDREGRIAARALAPLSERGLRRMLDPVVAES